MFSEFQLLRPWWLLAFVPLVLMLWRWLVLQRSGGLWEKVVDARLLKHVVTTASDSGRRFLPLGLFFCAGSLVIFAMAGPVWERWPQPVYSTQDPLVVVLDLSRSMDAADIKPNRITRARHKIRDLLRRRPDGQTALLVYAAQAFVVTPLTQDTQTIGSLIPVLETNLMPEQGTRPDLALLQANTLLEQSEAGPGHVLLITDGLDDVDVSEAVDTILAAGHRISVLGVGTPAGAPIPSRQGGFITNQDGEVVVSKLRAGELADLATRGQGGFQTLSSGNTDLLALMGAMVSNTTGDEQQGLQTDVWREEGPWLLLLALPLIALAFRRGVIAVVCVMVVLPYSPTVDALQWQDLWRTKDQQGAKALADEDAEHAAELFADPNWKAAAKYRAGQFQDSASLWDGLDSVDAYYNRGNALARQGPEFFDQAIASYNQALDLEPDHEDAQYNRDLLLQQQQQEQEQQDGDQSEEQNEDESEQQESTEGGDSEQEQEEEQQQQQEQEGEQEQQQAQSEYDEEFESDQADEQWLRKIPDDPGGLLRRKFRYQYQRRNPSRSRRPQEEKW